MIISCIRLLCVIGSMAMIWGIVCYYDLKIGCWFLNRVRAVIRIINRELFAQERGDDKLC